jgi:hypothetical protein
MKNIITLPPLDGKTGNSVNWIGGKPKFDLNFDPKFLSNRHESSQIFNLTVKAQNEDFLKLKMQIASPNTCSISAPYWSKSDNVRSFAWYLLCKNTKLLSDSKNVISNYWVTLYGKYDMQPLDLKGSTVPLMVFELSDTDSETIHNLKMQLRRYWNFPKVVIFWNIAPLKLWLDNINMQPDAMFHLSPLKITQS